MNTLFAAIAAWRRLLGEERVKTQAFDLQRYHADTTNTSRIIAGVLRPISTSEVVDIVKIASAHQIALYPISKGNNWGYGSANPTQNGCVIVDLSGMTQISEFDAKLGVVTLEPGVTQEQLATFLMKQNDLYITPTTSTGPDGTILGNAIERGYGLVPIADHFLAVMNIEVVLADGSIYHSAIHGKECTEVDGVFKWGIGPYLDGLFSQSNFGIVTKATIALRPKPECIEMFFIEFDKEEDLEDAVVTVRKILKDVGVFSGAINIMSDLRLSAVTADYPFDEIAAAPHHTKAILKRKAKESGYYAWTCMGSLYGHKYVIQAVKKEIIKIVKERSKRVLFLSQEKILFIDAFLSRLPVGFFSKIKNRFSKMTMILDILSGKPRQETLHICYRQLRQGVPQGKNLNPAQDGCGIYWYAPLLPLQPSTVRDYVNFVDATCEQYGIEPLITLTSMSERCIISPIPILFDPMNTEQAWRAKECLAALIEGGRQRGAYPHRAGVGMMKDVVDPSHSFWNVQQSIKQALDPQNIMSPGRYSQ